MTTLPCKSLGLANAFHTAIAATGLFFMIDLLGYGAENDSFAVFIGGELDIVKAVA